MFDFTATLSKKIPCAAVTIRLLLRNTTLANQADDRLLLWL